MFMIPRAFASTFGQFSHCRSPLRLYESDTRLVEDEKAYQIIAAVPGVSPDGVKVRVSEDAVLSVTATKTSTEETVLQKRFSLPQDADVTSVHVSCENGLLEVTISKLEPKEPVTVAVRAEEAPEVSGSDCNQVFEVRKRIPGIAADQVVVKIETVPKAGTELLSVDAKSDHAEYHYQFPLADDAISSGASAFCKDGLLTLRIPRRQAPAPVVLTVDSSIEEANGEEVELVKLPVAGFTAENIKLEAKQGYVRVGLSKNDGEVTRHVAIPDEILDLSCLKAGCTDGVLYVKVPKSAVRQYEETEVEINKPAAQ